LLQLPRNLGFPDTIGCREITLNVLISCLRS
jgi:hypothetical protein